MSANHLERAPGANHRPSAVPHDRPRRYALCMTLRCNLACDYCCVHRRPATMSLDLAGRAVDFLYRITPPTRPIDFAFFGGEPFRRASGQTITRRIEDLRAYDSNRVSLAVASNGTVFSEQIAPFLVAHDVEFCVSCDGPPQVQDIFRTPHEAAPRPPPDAALSQLFRAVTPGVES